MDTLTLVRNALASGHLDAFVGLPEDEYFEAKRATSYSRADAADRYELAKDVISFCNAGGGYIIIGLVTERQVSRPVDVVGRTELIAEDPGRCNSILGVVKAYTYPEIVGLSVVWYQSADDPSRGVIALSIPRQSDDRRPFVTLHVEEDNQPLRRIVLGYAERRGGDSTPFDPRQLQQALRRGMDGVSQRLSRLEEKLDRLFEARSTSVSGIPELAVDKQITDGITEILEE